MNNFAFPSQFRTAAGELNEPADGLTKRELFAAMALQGLLAHPKHFDEALEAANDKWREAMSNDAVLHADQLISALSEQQP